MAFIVLAADSDQTLRAYAGPESTWTLVEMNGAPVSVTATLRFPEAGVISGKAPCNRYNTALTVPYPWFETGPIAATRMACPDLQSEAAYFGALEAATLAEVRDGHTLILSNETDVLLVFKIAD